MEICFIGRPELALLWILWIMRDFRISLLLGLCNCILLCLGLQLVWVVGMWCERIMARAGLLRRRVVSLPPYDSGLRNSTAAWKVGILFVCGILTRKERIGVGTCAKGGCFEHNWPAELIYYCSVSFHWWKFSIPSHYWCWILASSESNTTCLFLLRL